MVSNPGGGYTISDSVTAVYSMQVSGDSNSGTYTLEHLDPSDHRLQRERKRRRGGLTLDDRGAGQLSTQLPVRRQLRGGRRRVGGRG